MGDAGLSVCYDLRFPGLYRALAFSGAQYLCIPAAFTHFTGRDHWHVLLRARAIENGCYVFAPAQAGHHDDGRHTYGHSMILDPWGRVVAEASEDRPEIITADIDGEEIEKARGAIPALSQERTGGFSVLRENAHM